MAAKYNVGIIGFGFVGRAVAHGFGLDTNVLIYDKYLKGYDSEPDFIRLVLKSDFIFNCVPTPVDDHGKQDLSIVEEITERISKQMKPTNQIYIIKTTVIPGSCRKLHRLYPDFNIVHIPEFLTERNSKLDFINTARIILGIGPNDLTKGKFPSDSKEYRIENECIGLFRLRFPHTPIFSTSWEGAELVKYMANLFFASKISFMNEFYDIGVRLGVPFEQLKEMFLSDMRIGNSHCDVPGHDGDRGFGGKCFPKDLQSLITWAHSQNLSVQMLEATQEVNERVRTDRNWDAIPGATSKKGFEKK